jgi:hypothetical protein
LYGRRVFSLLCVLNHHCVPGNGFEFDLVELGFCDECAWDRVLPSVLLSVNVRRVSSHCSWWSWAFLKIRWFRFQVIDLIKLRWSLTNGLDQLTAVTVRIIDYCVGESGCDVAMAKKEWGFLFLSNLVIMFCCNCVFVSVYVVTRGK